MLTKKIISKGLSLTGPAVEWTLTQTRQLQAWGRTYADRLRKNPKDHRNLIVGLALGLFLPAAVGLYYFSTEGARYEALLDERVALGLFDAQPQAYSAPYRLHVGDAGTVESLTTLLVRLGYRRDEPGPAGSFRSTAEGLEIDPRPTPAFNPGVAGLKLADGKIQRISQGKRRLNNYELRPQILTALADTERTRRTLVAYSQLPPSLVQAVTAIEDHRFFAHGGLDLMRTAMAALEGLAQWEKPRGTSTLTQQLARGLLLSRERTYSRKWKELLIARGLEQRFTKEQIFEIYSNFVYMGRQGSYDIAGMGEASRVYFSKDVGVLEVHESALLAGILQRPSYLNPFRYPDRARNRRDTVLRAMAEHGSLTEPELEQALAEPLGVVESDFDAERAPHFVDLIRAELEARPELSAAVAEGGEIHTTLVPELQRVAMAAVREGMKAVDAALAKQKRFAGVESPPRPQCALVALDPETGEIVALVGGRDYERTQLNRALARRQPGSAFKPFVYAAAFEYKPKDAARMTPLSVVANSPLQITIRNEIDGDEIYQPTNYGKGAKGFVTFREALVRSLNIPTVRVAKHVGYRRVAELARKAGMPTAGPTPSLALGTYEVSPLELAEAYTIFANGGERVTPHAVRIVSGPGAAEPIPVEPQRSRVIRRDTAFMVTDMMADVLDRGTGFRARSAGFWAPAAGKTGTDDDGWFAGFSSRLLCVVWVGFDDNTDLKIDGGASALPIWAAFMKGALAEGRFRDPGGFEAPEGVAKKYVRPEFGRSVPDGVELPDMELFFEDESGQEPEAPVVIEIQPDEEPPVPPASFEEPPA